MVCQLNRLQSTHRRQGQGQPLQWCVSSTDCSLHIDDKGKDSRYNGVSAQQIAVYTSTTRARTAVTMVCCVSSTDCSLHIDDKGKDSRYNGVSAQPDCSLHIDDKGKDSRYNGVSAQQIAVYTSTTRARTAVTMVCQLNRLQSTHRRQGQGQPLQWCVSSTDCSLHIDDKGKDSRYNGVSAQQIAVTHRRQGQGQPLQWCVSSTDCSDTSTTRARTAVTMVCQLNRLHLTHRRQGQGQPLQWCVSSTDCI